MGGICSMDALAKRVWSLPDAYWWCSPYFVGRYAGSHLNHCV